MLSLAPSIRDPLVATPSPFALLNRGLSTLAWLTTLASLQSSAAGQCATQWVSGPDSGTNGRVFALTTLHNGDIVAGGEFSMAGGVAASRIARWNGASWSPLGSGIDPLGQVQSLVTLPNGDLIAAGGFTTAGGVAANNIARWDGSTWSTLGSGLNNAVIEVATLPNGDVVAAGAFTTAGGVSANRVARWDGTSWWPLGSGTDSTVFSMTTLLNGDVVVGGNFSTAGGVSAPWIARWNGTAWSGLGSGMNHIPFALMGAANGDLIAGGAFTMAGGVAVKQIARWDGTSWSPLGSGINTVGVLEALTTLPNGDLVVGGYFSSAGGVATSSIARWDGAVWSAFGSGLDDFVYAFTAGPGGELIVGGTFTEAGGQPSAHLARLSATCPATQESHGAGCFGPGGNNLLTATSLPWIDTTFRAVGTNLPTNALVLSVHGFTSFSQGQLPLTLAFAQANPGCDLLVAPDIFVLLTTTTGSAQSTVFVPNVPPIVGMSFYHQMVPIELDAQGAWVSVTATNALQLTAGTF